jgi:hypothetical protein
MLEIAADFLLGIKHLVCPLLAGLAVLPADIAPRLVGVLAKRLFENRRNTFCTKEIVARNTISAHNNRSLCHGPPETSTTGFRDTEESHAFLPSRYRGAPTDRRISVL